jgi:hypothetical protein
MSKTSKLPFVCCFIGLWLIMGVGSVCGKDDRSASRALKACELLTKAEIESIIGGKVDEPTQMFKDNQKQKFWMSTCNYYSPDTAQSAGILIQTSINPDPVKAFESHKNSLKKALGEKYNLQNIDGIGTRAAWDGSVKQLTVFEGSRMLIISISRPKEGQGTALVTAKMIAAKVLSKLRQ